MGAHEANRDVGERGTVKIRSRFGVTSVAATSAIVAASRAFSAEKNLKGRQRPSSFPFVSGDTFRAVSDFVFDVAMMRELDSTRLSLPRPPQVPSIVFVEFNVLDVERWRLLVDGWLKSAADTVSGNVIIATNGDRAPRQLLEDWAEQGNIVFAHNAFDDYRGVTPIPIGLQNLSHKKSGVLEDYLLYHDGLRQGNHAVHERNQLVFASFNVANRPDERGELARLLEDSPYQLENRRIRPRDFRRRLLTSKFVLSPPGAGPDCHRTWEALLLGAVPVVLRSSLAKSLYQDSAVYAVDNWQDFLNKDPHELDSIWNKKVSLGAERAYFSPWFGKINSARSTLSTK